eukprot:TRINITY_DN7529_c0_g1_i1.p1 TRINITY_DN7529_c0_g1~~TRINITY_DN7529_c0_g1_i1.p1  ORF type:complete len:379 (+),score=115.98 TRINITY_DN7529_c0_g1_i1:76-1212(+)
MFAHLNVCADPPAVIFDDMGGLQDAAGPLRLRALPKVIADVDGLWRIVKTGVELPRADFVWAFYIFTGINPSLLCLFWELVSEKKATIGYVQFSSALWVWLDSLTKADEATEEAVHGYLRAARTVLVSRFCRKHGASLLPPGHAHNKDAAQRALFSVLPAAVHLNPLAAFAMACQPEEDADLFPTCGGGEAEEAELAAAEGVKAIPTPPPPDSSAAAPAPRKFAAPAPVEVEAARESLVPRDAILPHPAILPRLQPVPARTRSGERLARRTQKCTKRLWNFSPAPAVVQCLAAPAGDWAPGVTPPADTNYLALRGRSRVDTCRSLRSLRTAAKQDAPAAAPLRATCSGNDLIRARVAAFLARTSACQVPLAREEAIVG